MLAVPLGIADAQIRVFVVTIEAARGPRFRILAMARTCTRRHGPFADKRAARDSIPASAEIRNLVIDSPGGGIIVISPDFIQ